MCHLSEQKLKSICKEILAKGLGEIVALNIIKIDPELDKRYVPWWSTGRKWEREDIGYVTVRYRVKNDLDFSEMNIEFYKIFEFIGEQ